MSDDRENKVVPIRNEKGRFVKGAIANPTGTSQPKALREIKTGGGIEELFRANAPAVYEEMLRLILKRDTPAGSKASLIKTFFERGYGKPAVTVPTPDEQVYEGIDVTALSLEALEEIERAAKGVK